MIPSGAARARSLAHGEVDRVRTSAESGVDLETRKMGCMHPKVRRLVDVEIPWCQR